MTPLSSLLRRKWFAIPAGIALFVAIVLTWLVTTTSGARVLIHFAARNPVATIAIERIEGRLIGPLHLYGITIRSPITETKVGHLELDWTVSRLLSRAVHIHRLVIEDVTASLAAAPPKGPEPAAKKPSAPPGEFPLEIVIEEARVTGVQLLTAQGMNVNDLQILLNGRLDDYHLDLAARVAAEGQPPADVSLKARGTLRDITVEELTVATLGGQAVARAHASWHPGVAWEAAAHVDRVQPGLLCPDPEAWPGWISADLRTEGRLDDRGQPVGWASIDTLSGELRGHPLRGTMRADWSGLERATMGLDLNWSTLTLRADASLSDSMRADLTLECADLGGVVPQGEGAFDVKANVRGLRASPRLDAALVAENLKAAAGTNTSSAARVAANLSVQVEGLESLAALAPDSTAGAGLRLPDITATGDLRVDDAAFNQVTLDSTEFRIEGTPEEHRARLITAGPQLAAGLEITGGIDAGTLRWAGRIDTLRFVSGLAGDWSLCAPAAIEASPASGRVDSLCLHWNDAEIHLTAAWADSQWSAAAAIEDVPLSMADSHLVAGQSLRGSLHATIDASGRTNGAYTARADAALDGAWFVFPIEKALDSLALEPVRLTASGGAEGVTARLEAVVAGSGPSERAEFHADVGLPEYRSLADSLPIQPVRASVRGEVSDLALLNGIDPRVRDNSGRVTVSVDAEGTVTRPTVSGEIRVVDAATFFPDLGVRVSDIQLSASGDLEAGYVLAGSARSGEGDVAIEGRIPAKPSTADPVDVTIRGERFQLLHTPEMEAEASPDVSLVYDTERLTVKGRLVLPLVNIELMEVPETAVAPSTDVILVDVQERAAPFPVDTWVDAEIVLGPEVVFRGFAFSVDLAGSLEVQQHVPEPPAALGQINIPEGFYRAYGQNLTIENGVVSFTGPIESGALNIKAFRVTPDDVTAGVHITGTVESPILKVYSEPVMSETQAISYLVTGRPLDAGSGSDKANVGSAAALLGSNVLSSQLGSKVGLDEARIETGGGLNEASLVTGKYLSPRIYLSYAMGLFDRSNLIRVRYIFSPKWAVQAETGTTMGTDLFYKIERGGGD